MASGKNSRAVRNARTSVVTQRSIPWITIAAVTAVLVFAGGIFGFVYFEWAAKEEVRAATAPFRPSPQNPDPSLKIPGVVTEHYKGQQHVAPDQRVAYDKAPPFGGPHDSIWAACMGTVYEQPVRNENMVHSLEHGAVWIAYNPQQVKGDALDRLKERVEGHPYTMMSPYPGLASPISLQSWGHQLKVEKADDPRIDQFITALRQNNNGVYPEIGGTCQAIPGAFDPENPPPFDSSPPPPDAVGMNGEGAQKATGNMGAPQGQ